MLIQTIWDHEEIPEQMNWMVVFLLLKGGGDFQEIGLLNPCWKVVEMIMVCRLADINFHRCLHGAELLKWGTGTATTEAKLVQQLARMEQELLYQMADYHLDQE